MKCSDRRGVERQWPEILQLLNLKDSAPQRATNTILTFGFFFSFSVMREDAVTLRLLALCKSDAGSKLPSAREALS